jgi:serine/threonine-protein kinase
MSPRIRSGVYRVLEHPGIVLVYSLGSHASGRPFYAMRFVRGDSLKEAIERFPP